VAAWRSSAFVADYCQAARIGYMNGLAVTILVGQLPKLCGSRSKATD